MSYIFRIKDWRKNYEKMQSKRVCKLSWVPIPLKTNGNGYQRIWRLPNAVQVWAGWILLVQYAAMQPSPELRGNLYEDQEPTDCETIAIKLSAHYDCIMYAIIATCASDLKIKWIEAKRIDEDDRKWRFLSSQELQNIFSANSASVAATSEVCTTRQDITEQDRTKGFILNPLLKTPESTRVESPEKALTANDLHKLILETQDELRKQAIADNTEAMLAYAKSTLQDEQGATESDDQGAGDAKTPENDRRLPEAVKMAFAGNRAVEEFVVKALEKIGWMDSTIQQVVEDGKGEMENALACVRWTLDRMKKGKMPDNPANFSFAKYKAGDVPQEYLGKVKVMLNGIASDAERSALAELTGETQEEEVW